MIRITKADMKSISYAICVLTEVKRNTVDPRYIEQVVNHVHRLRKVQLLIVAALSQDLLSFDRSIREGIDSSHSSHAFCSKP